MIELGNKKIVSDFVYDNTNEPQFFESFEIEHRFPGASDLIISFYDKDTIKYDDLIGKIKIDVERRFFDRIWRAYKHIPIEKQDIKHPKSNLSNGEAYIHI